MRTRSASARFVAPPSSNSTKPSPTDVTFALRWNLTPSFSNAFCSSAAISRSVAPAMWSSISITVTCEPHVWK